MAYFPEQGEAKPLLSFLANCRDAAMQDFAEQDGALRVFSEVTARRIAMADVASRAQQAQREAGGAYGF